MVIIKLPEEIEKARASNQIVAEVLSRLREKVKPGVTTKELDKFAEDIAEKRGAKPAFKGYRGYPYSLCTSINEEVVHGIPGERVLRNGDIVSIDCGSLKYGLYGDSAYTFTVGEVAPDVLKLLRRTKESLFFAVKMAIVGKRIGDIGSTIQDYVESFGYGVVRELVGHGIGRKLHEKPDIPNYGKKGTGIKLQEGLTICIEPMINMGTKNIVQSKDGWTIRTADKLPSAHFELTIVVKKEVPEVLSTFQYIEEVLGTNQI